MFLCHPVHTNFSIITISQSFDDATICILKVLRLLYDVQIELNFQVSLVGD